MAGDRGRQEWRVFKLRWPRSERGRPFQKHRLTLGLICPNEDVEKGELVLTNLRMGRVRGFHRIG